MSDELPPEAHRLRPDHLPTPFSAEQIRDGCPPGRLIWLRTEVPGQDPAFRQIRFTRIDDVGAAHEIRSTDPDGMPTGEPVEGYSTWLDLQGHASQPADRTELGVEDLELTWGSEPCWRYLVRDGADETRFWFARRLPGMPVRIESWTDGTLTERVEVIAKSVTEQ